MTIQLRTFPKKWVPLLHEAIADMGGPSLLQIEPMGDLYVLITLEVVDYMDIFMLGNFAGHIDLANSISKDFPEMLTNIAHITINTITPSKN